ncbi:MAG: histone deacetylase [Bacteroidota bacterium]
MNEISSAPLPKTILPPHADKGARLYISWSALYAHPLPEGHRFPMEKYELIPEQLLYEGTITEDNLYDPGKVTEEMVLLTHDKAYWEKLKHGTLSPKEVRRTGFPYSPRLIERALTIPMGTIQNVRFAQKYGVAINGAGGTHHAFTDRGEGFCLLNDIAIAANYLLAWNEISQALVIDLDVHQGNGTAQIFQQDPRVYTLSVHGAANYPLRKEESDLDIPLPTGIEDDEYLSRIGSILPKLFDEVNPDVVFYLSGVDVLETDRLGLLSLSRAGCKARDELVFAMCKEREVPMAVSLGGGYSRQVKDIVEAHCNTFRAAQDIFF